MNIFLEFVRCSTTVYQPDMDLHATIQRRFYCS